MIGNSWLAGPSVSGLNVTVIGMLPSGASVYSPLETLNGPAIEPTSTVSIEVRLAFLTIRMRDAGGMPRPSARNRTALATLKTPPGDGVEVAVGVGVETVVAVADGVAIGVGEAVAIEVDVEVAVGIVLAVAVGIGVEVMVAV